MNTPMRNSGSSPAVQAPAAAPPQPITLEWLLENLEPEQLHLEIASGPPAGREFK